MKIFQHGVLIYFTVATLLLASAVSHADNALANKYYVNLKEGSSSLVIETCKKIYNLSGITDRRIFDFIEERLLTTLKAEKLTKQERNESIWLMKALSSSGSMRYEASLKVVSENKSIKRKLRKTAQKALEEIPRFARWNVVINSTEHEMNGRKASLALWMRLLDSDAGDMNLAAIEKARSFAVYDINFLILLEDKLRAVYPLEQLKMAEMEFQKEAMHYLMEHPEYGKYTSLVNEVAEKSPNKPVSKAARKALR